ncbi:protein kinase, partial [Metarhizium majus ARSEF 297]
MPVAKDLHATVTATDVLAFDESQLVQYLERNAVNGGGFDISGLLGVENLSKDQRNELAEKLRSAAPTLDNSTLEIEDLLTRLTRVADERNDSSEHDLSRSPAASFQSTASTSPISFMSLEISCHQELVNDGGRPVCSIEDLTYILTKPRARYKAIMPWLSDDPDSEVWDGEIKTVFSRQFTRWWDFRKSQWDNRRIDIEAGFSSFLEANKRKYEGMGATRMVSDPSFEETVRRLWQHKPVSRQLPESNSFTSYKEAVRRRLAPYQSARALQLKEDPRQQTQWTNWLEYLNYEKWCLEMLTALAEPLEDQYREAWRRMLTAPRGSSREAKGCSSSASRFMQKAGRRPADIVNMAKELEATHASLVATNKTLDDFIRETEPYLHAQTAVYYQRHRVEWIIKEASLIELEMSQQNKMVKTKACANTRENKKRQRDDDKIPPTRSKRVKQGDGREHVVSEATLGEPGLRRSRRLAQGKSLQSRV